MTIVLSSSRLATSTSSFITSSSAAGSSPLNGSSMSRSCLRLHELLRDRDALPLAARELRRIEARRGRPSPKRSSSSRARFLAPRRASCRCRRPPAPGCRAPCGGAAADSPGRRRRPRPAASGLPSGPSTVPASGASSPAMMRRRRVLPTPEGPSSPTTCPVIVARAHAVLDLEADARRGSSVCRRALGETSSDVERARSPSSRSARRQRGHRARARDGVRAERRRMSTPMP